MGKAGDSMAHKIAIIGLHDLYRMQFLYKYTDILDKNGIEYDVIWWDRKGDPKLHNKRFKGNEIVFYEEMRSNSIPKYQKIPSYLRAIKRTREAIRKGGYDRFILLTTQTVLPLFLSTGRIRNGAYVFDYRDVTFEGNGIARKLILATIRKSKFTAISSMGFVTPLGMESNLIMSHNESQFACISVEKKPSDVIRVSFWGGVRQNGYVKKLCDLFGNHAKFAVSFYGEGRIEELRQYCADQGYSNIVFTGRYVPEQIPEFAANTDILLNMYENDSVQRYALTVKLYDGIKFGLPMLLTKDSYMASLMESNPNCLAIDPESADIGEIEAWYRGLNLNDGIYQQEIEQILADDKVFEEKLLDFVL